MKSLLHARRRFAVAAFLLLLLLLLLVAAAVPTCEALASPSSSSAARKKGGGGGGGGGGFGASSKSKESWKVHETDDSAATRNLLEFLKSRKGTQVDSVEIGRDPATGMRGLFATKKISQGKIICQIPSDFALALSDPSKVGQEGEKEPTIAEGAANFLRMYVHEPNAKKLWSPYLDTLPTQKSVIEGGAMTPDYFSDEEIELLEFPRLIEQVKQRKGDVERVATELGLDEDELRYATWLVSSRAFAIQLAVEGKVNDEDEVLRDERGQVITKAGVERKGIRVLVPFIDMANHKSSMSCNARLTLIDPEKDDAFFALEATRNVSPGKEVTISYGSGTESSVELLLNYGFVDMANPIDRMMLKKGGDDAIADAGGWTTTLEEDRSMFNILQSSDEDDDDAALKKILAFRIKLKESYDDPADA